MARRRRKGKMPAGLARYWASKRKRNTPHRKQRRARQNQPFVLNSPKRRRRRNPHVRAHHRRRSYRRNPMPRLIPTMGFIQEIGMVAGGYYATKISAGFVLPMIGIAGDIPRIAVKGVVAWGVAWLGGMMLGSKAQQNILIGGALEVMQDAIKTYVSPFVPALAAAEMESYYLPGATVPGGPDRTVGTYYQVGELPGDNYAQ